MNFDITIIKSNVKEVSSIAVVHDGKILMGKRNDNQRWTLPGGGLNKDEDPVDGAARELFEEAGIKVEPKELKHLKTKKIKTFTGKQMTIHAFQYKWDGERPTSKNDPDKEVKKWEWVDYSDDELPEEVASNLHSPKNVVLQAMGLTKGGVGSGVRGHHTDEALVGENSKPLRQPDHEHDWDMSGLISDKRDKDRSLFYVSPKRKLKNRIEDEKIKRIEEESWKKLMENSKKKSFHIFIDLMKAAGHKYIRKYKKGDKWIYIYHEGSQRPRKLEDEAFKIIKRMAELGHEGAKNMLENMQDDSSRFEELKKLARKHGSEHMVVDRSVGDILKDDFSYDKEGESLERDILGEAEKDTVERQMDDSMKNNLKAGLDEAVDIKTFGHLEGHRTDPLFTKLAEHGITRESLKEGVLEARSLKEAMAKLHENLKKLDEAHMGLRSQNSFANGSNGPSGYANAIYNHVITKLQQSGSLPQGYAGVHKRTDVGALSMPKASELERIQREAREREERERAEAAERLRRENEELFTIHGDTLRDTLEYYNLTLNDEAKVKFMKGVDKFFGKDFKFKNLISNLQGHPDVEIKMSGSWVDSMLRGERNFSATFTFLERSTGREITRASRSVSKNSDGSIHWANGCFSRPNNRDLARFKGMATGLYAGVEKSLREITANYVGSAKKNTKITIGSAANSGWSNDGYKGALVWAKHCFDWEDQSAKSRWKSTWKNAVDNYSRRAGMSQEDADWIKNKIDTCEYPEDFVRLGIKVNKQQALALTGRTTLDFDFDQIFEQKGYCDLGEIIMINDGSSWGAQNYIWGEDARSVELNRRRAIQYRWSNERRSESDKKVGELRPPTASTSPSASSSSTGSTSPPSSDYNLNMAQHYMRVWAPSGRNRSIAINEARLRKMRHWGSDRIRMFLRIAPLSAGGRARVRELLRQLEAVPF